MSVDATYTPYSSAFRSAMIAPSVVKTLLSSVVHSGSIEQFRNSVLARGGEVVESRDATLEEIFLARAGRNSRQVEAA